MKFETAIIKPIRLDDVLETPAKVGIHAFTVTETKDYGQSGPTEVESLAHAIVRASISAEISTNSVLPAHARRPPIFAVARVRRNIGNGQARRGAERSLAVGVAGLAIKEMVTERYSGAP